MLACQICGLGDRFVSGKTHKSRSRHVMCAMHAGERAQEVAWYREVRVEGLAARQRALQQKRRQSRQRRSAFEATCGARDPDTSADVGPLPADSLRGVYTFGFRKHSGKNLLNVWRTEPKHLGHLMMQGGAKSRPSLKRAMEAAGIYEVLTRRGGGWRSSCLPVASRRETSRGDKGCVLTSGRRSGRKY